MTNGRMRPRWPFIIFATTRAMNSSRSSEGRRNPEAAKRSSGPSGTVQAPIGAESGSVRINSGKVTAMGVKGNTATSATKALPEPPEDSRGRTGGGGCRGRDRRHHRRRNGHSGGPTLHHLDLLLTLGDLQLGDPRLLDEVDQLLKLPKVHLSLHLPASSTHFGY